MPEMPVIDQPENYKGRGAGERVRKGAFAPAPLLTFIILAYLAIGTLYATLTPAWQVPDEPAHFNVIRQIAQTGTLPTLQKGDYNQEYLGQIVDQKFPPELSVEGVQYQDYQPPLYYVLAAPVFLLSGGSLVAVRLFSLALGVGVLVFAFLITRSLINAWAGVMAAAFIAFIPQHLSIMAGVNNDALSELLIAVGLWLVVRGQKLGIKGQPPVWLFGLILGLAFITKVQAYILAPVFFAHALLLWRKRSELVDGRRLVRWLMVVFGIGLALGAVYWGRNFFVCGPWDVVCGAWHNQVVVGQPTTAEWIVKYGWWGSADALLNRFFTFTFQSFWGQFGWMSVVMDWRVYAALLLFTVMLLIGFGGKLLENWKLENWGLAAWQRNSLLLLAFSALLTLGLYIYYNFGFVQHQGRYLFPALVPLSVAAAASLRQWAKWLSALPLVGRFAPYFPAVPLAGLAALSVFALFRFILPALG